jgi:hypothetical protein
MDPTQGSKMSIKTALVFIFLSATPALTQEITNHRDANGNLPRDKGISTNTNPTNARTSFSAQSFSTQGMPAKPAAPPAAKPTSR